MKTKRLPWLLAALAGIALLLVFSDAPVTSVVAAVRPTHPDGGADHGVFLRALTPRHLPVAVRPGPDPFAALPPRVADAPAEPPTAVPLAPTFSEALPYRVIGKQLAEGNEGGWTVFLAHGEDTWVVREGDALGDNYRVAAIKPPHLTLQHIRNKTRRTLDIGEIKE